MHFLFSFKQKLKSTHTIESLYPTFTQSGTELKNKINKEYKNLPTYLQTDQKMYKLQITSVKIKQMTNKIYLSKVTLQYCIYTLLSAQRPKTKQKISEASPSNCTKNTFIINFGHQAIHSANFHACPPFISYKCCSQSKSTSKHRPNAVTGYLQLSYPSQLPNKRHMQWIVGGL